MDTTKHEHTLKDTRKRGVKETYKYPEHYLQVDTEEHRMGKSVSFLYKMARTANDIETLASGNPKRIVKRGRNKVIGRTLMKNLMK